MRPLKGFQWGPSNNLASSDARAQDRTKTKAPDKTPQKQSADPLEAGPVATFFDDKVLNGPFGPLFASIGIVGSFLTVALPVALTTAQAGGGGETASVTGVLLGIAAGAWAMFEATGYILNSDDRTAARKSAKHMEAMRESMIRGSLFEIGYEAVGSNAGELEKLTQAALTVAKKTEGAPEYAMNLIEQVVPFAQAIGDTPLDVVVRNTPLLKKSKDKQIRNALKRRDTKLTMGLVLGELLKAAGATGKFDRDKVEQALSEAIPA